MKLSDINENTLSDIIDLMDRGYSIKEIARRLRIARSTLYLWMEKSVQLSDTIKLGVEFSEGWWMEKGRENIDNKEFNSTLWYMNMKNRFGWKDKSENTQTLIAMDYDDIKKNLNDETKPC